MNLSEGNCENLQKKVEALMREGLKITDIMFENIERKVSRQTGLSGIVIVTCMSWADKDRILKAKRLLDQSCVYSNVSIKPDRSREQWTMDNNMRSLATAVGMIYRVTALCSEGSIFRRSYVQKVLCSEGPIFRRSYVQKVLCTEKNCSKVLYSEGSMFRRSYIQIYSEGPIFRKFFVLCRKKHTSFSFDL